MGGRAQAPHPPLACTSPQARSLKVWVKVRISSGSAPLPVREAALAFDLSFWIKGVKQWEEVMGGKSLSSGTGSGHHLHVTLGRSLPTSKPPFSHTSNRCVGSALWSASSRVGSAMPQTYWEG